MTNSFNSQETPPRDIKPFLFGSDKKRTALPQPRILLAEDQTFNQLLAKELLSRLGCEVTVVGNGREAVELADRVRFDAVLMDCRMPVMDGFEAARRLRQLRHGAGVPILAVTANAMAEDREHCLAAGMDDVLAKPYDQSQLCELLGRWIT